MNLMIMDYKCRTKEIPVDTDNMDDIEIISIEVVSGDEIAKIGYKSGDIQSYDSSNSRWMDLFGGEYILYCPAMGINKIDEFNKRKSSYNVF